MNDLLATTGAWSGFALLCLGATVICKRIERHYDRRNRA